MSPTEPRPALATFASLPQLFRAVVADRGDALAVVDGRRRLRYTDLDAASDRLAARLCADGVRPGEFVGIMLPRSADVVIAILGVLKSGAAYLPIDPVQPPERIRHLLADAQVRRLVTDGPPPTGCEVRIVSPRAAGTARIPADWPDVRPSDPAYLIYTSGSTGTPKGCVVSHGNLLALLPAALSLISVDTTDRWALFHSSGFDVSVWELWGCLATGATAVVVPLEVARSAPDLLQLLADARITVLCQVPSAFRALAHSNAQDRGHTLTLRQLILAGESVELDVVRDFLHRLPGPAPVVLNMYGPTETTVYATGRVLTRDDLSGSVRSPIGTELPGVRAEIRDPHGRAVPLGSVGELWLTGPTVTRGYLDRPDLTAERFVVDEDDPTVRYYRTGDLVRRLPDGALEYLGRNDRQLKLRGYRIEPGEIEAVLRAAAEVREAAVVLTTTPGGAQLLVAFVVPDGPAAPDLAARLRRHGGALLPPYMVPARYRPVARLPVTTSGKVDRTELERLARTDAEATVI
ncbi:amino acid adenylation domain-containing protein [Micromonospora sp. NPDC007230]|uniref:amino acid adenylation domain-containing protein n=1 Tax=Micromonospora sp. NPDC007230 TaxID=3364237 RepID=UPI0036795569